jgi:oligoendopeptidase F
LGIDLADPEFWARGYAVVGEMVGELKELVRGEW